MELTLVWQMALDLDPTNSSAGTEAECSSGAGTGVRSSSRVGSDCCAPAGRGAEAISRSGSGVTAGTGAGSGKFLHGTPGPSQAGWDAERPPAASVRESLEAVPTQQPGRTEEAGGVGGQAVEAEAWPFLPCCLLKHLCRGLGPPTPGLAHPDASPKPPLTPPWLSWQKQAWSPRRELTKSLGRGMLSVKV